MENTNNLDKKALNPPTKKEKDKKDSELVNTFIIYSSPKKIKTTKRILMI